MTQNAAVRDLVFAKSDGILVDPQTALGIGTYYARISGGEIFPWQSLWWKYDDTIVMITGLAPGQTMTEEGMFTNELPVGAVCKITEVQRTAS